MRHLRTCSQSSERDSNSENHSINSSIQELAPTKPRFVLHRRLSFGRAILTRHSVSTNQRRPLLVLQDTTPPVLREDPDRAPDDPDEGQDSEDEGSPVDESGGALLGEDGPEGPGDGDGGGEVAFRGRECVGCGGGFEEEECEEDEDLVK